VNDRYTLITSGEPKKTVKPISHGDISSRTRRRRRHAAFRLARVLSNG
jgi:hypothetical protein